MKSWETMAREKLRSSSWLACVPRRVRHQSLCTVVPLPAASGESSAQAGAALAAASKSSKKLCQRAGSSNLLAR